MRESAGRNEWWLYFFFFKQKTAYEIGTGDWSSDVCSSDLSWKQEVKAASPNVRKPWTLPGTALKLRAGVNGAEIGRASCRERV